MAAVCNKNVGRVSEGQLLFGALAEVPRVASHFSDAVVWWACMMYSVCPFERLVMAQVSRSA